MTLTTGVRSPGNNLGRCSYGYTYMWLLRGKHWLSAKRVNKPVANNLISGNIVDIIQNGRMSRIHESELPVNPERDLLKSPKGEKL